MLSVTCPHCQYHLRLVDELRGKDVSCSTCKKTFRISAAQPSEEEQRAARVTLIPPGQVKPPPRRLVAEESEPPDSLDHFRRGAWIACGVVCLGSFCNYLLAIHLGLRQTNAFEQAGAAGDALVWIATAAVIALAIDRCTRR